jgi:hypothetical protein
MTGPKPINFLNVLTYNKNNKYIIAHLGIPPQQILLFIIFAATWGQKS